MITEKLAKSRMKVVFDVTKDEFETALDKAFIKCNEKVTLKGFRKGKAPRTAYEAMYGVESLFDEALDAILNEKVQQVYADEKIANEICGKFEPNIETGEEKFERGKDFKVSLTFDVYPEVSLGQYKGVEVKKANPEATAVEIDAKIEELRNKNASLSTKEPQIIDSGDTAIFDFEGSVNGVKFEGGTAENYELVIGSNQFIPGFEDQMLGMNAGDVKDIKVTFPENYQAADLAGKEAVFKVSVHEVKEKKLPLLDDEYVKSLNIENVSNVEELKANKKAEIESTKAQSEKDRQVDAIINNILDNSVVEMPQSLIDQRVEQIRSQYINQAKMYNIPFDTFLGLMNITKEKFDEDTLTQGTRQALFNVVITKLIEVENLAPTKEELEAKALEMSANSKQTKEELLNKNVQSYYSEIAYAKVIEFLLANAKMI